MKLSFFAHAFLLSNRSHLHNNNKYFSNSVRLKAPNFSLKPSSRLFTNTNLALSNTIRPISSTIAPDPIKPLSSWQISNQLMSYFFSNENKLVVTMAILLTATKLALNLFSPYLLGQTTQLLSGSKQSSKFLGVDLNPQSMIIFCMLSYSASRLVLNFRDQLMVPVSINASKKLLNDIVLHLLSRDLTYHTNHSDSEKIYLIQKGVALGNVGTRLLTHFLPTIIELCFTSIWLSKKYGKVVSLLLFALMIAQLFSSIVAAKSIIQVRDKAIISDTKMWEEFGSAISKYKIMCDYEQLENTKFRIDSEQHKKAMGDYNLQITNLKVSFNQQVITSICLIMVSLLVGLHVQSGKYAINDFILIVNYFLQLTTILPVFADSVNQIIAVYPDVEFVFSQLLKTKILVDLYPDNPLRITSGSAPTIEFIDVAFSYPNRANNASEYVLKGLSFKILANQKVAFVSESGAGKTTIFNLLLRYYTPTSGTIKIDDQDISLVSLNSVRNTINLFGQNPNLFKGTVRQNICYGVQNQTLITDEEIWKIADSVGLAEFLRSLPAQLDTNVGDGGRSLSGGQQQKVAILRGLLKQPGSIRLFDEITASLDGQSAIQTLQKIYRESSDTTTLMISHKLSEMQFVDQIIVLDQGRVCAQGTHTELLKMCKIYQKLWYANLKKTSEQATGAKISKNNIFTDMNTRSQIDPDLMDDESFSPGC